ncbi:LOW QUALITY PROTEIN: hypothetical protein Cgig2_000421 [Carnegiea gigantea]|uniref:Aminotransferase-like plant mobile domain-containing protein n=1 Tax=Carnegiea gigantea TaxID=171969 RepID=A0A9Q1JPD9_9CARY|nr:LOW QUALITY PROTEIN: hypothetical protein Cgig2_000421 [Carnegiea gigantea]
MGAAVLKGHPSKVVTSHDTILFTNDHLDKGGKKVRKGTLSYSYNDEKSSNNGLCKLFDAMVLEKVNTKSNGDEKFLVTPSFCPALHKLLTIRRNWGSFMVGAIEWTEYILKHFEHAIRSANIYGAIGVSCYPYHFDRDVWGAFCELWDPLTNTLHHGAGEVGISIYDLERFAGLPILGDVYEEFLPRNEDLMVDEKFSPTVLELLRQHAELCRFHKSSYVSSFDFKCHKYWRLVAFLAFWLSRFVLPCHSEVIRPETFVMTSLIAKGQKISLALTVLGCIYHGLGQVASHPDHPVGWLAEVFPALYSQRPDSECPVDYPTLIAILERSPKGRDLVDINLLDENFKFLLCMRSSVLSIRIGSELLLEPYYPNRFARQFGFDQALLANRVSVFRSLKILHSLVDESHLSTVEISWLTSKVEEAFNTAEIWISNDSIFYLLKILLTRLKLLTWKITLKSYPIRLWGLNFERRRF